MNGRGLAWEDIPPELMRQAEIYKSEAGYLPEGAFGGVVNLDTNKPFDFKGFTVNGSIGGNYADYAGKAGPAGQPAGQQPLGHARRPDRRAVRRRLLRPLDQGGRRAGAASTPACLIRTSRSDSLSATRTVSAPYLSDTAGVYNGQTQAAGANGVGDPGAQQVFVP